MSPPFTARTGCRRRLHCRACRTDAAWRKRVGAPETCPHGITAAELPPPVPAKPRPRPAPPDPAVAAEARRRYSICRTCEHARDSAHACALRRGCCFGRWRARPDSHCPAGRW